MPQRAHALIELPVLASFIIEMTRSIKANGSNASKACDVMVVGGGNAGLCAAITARELGASVVLLEQAPKHSRGGNSRHARNLRVSHAISSDYLRGVYSAEEYWDDIARVAGENTDKDLARVMIAESVDVTTWMERRGVCFQRSRDTAARSRKTAYLLGGGKALLNAYYLTAERLGVDIRYDSEVLSLGFDDGMARDATVVTDGVPAQLRAKAVVVASGGIAANIDWLRQYWGEAANHCLIRGTAYADGHILKELLDRGAAPVGDPAQCHMVAVDARAPKFDGGIVTRLDGLPFGIVVDRNGRRFHDEGENVGRERYAIWGSLVLRCPGQIAYAIFDSKVDTLFRPSLYPPIQAPTVAELAVKLTLDSRTMAATVSRFNDAVRDASNGGKNGYGRTEGITPPKTRGALLIDTPPFGGFPVRPGITFSYFGVRVDQRARVLMANDRPSANVFAAGLSMAANILGRGYLAGMGMTIGTTFGRTAGREAAQYVLQ